MAKLTLREFIIDGVHVWALTRKAAQESLDRWRREELAEEAQKFLYESTTDG